VLAATLNDPDGHASTLDMTFRHRPPRDETINPPTQSGLDKE
jgi:hypothetical protein